MTVISTDGAYIHPEKDISSLTLSNGERYDLNMVIRKLNKNHLSESLTVKTTCFTKYLSYLNPKVEDSSSKFD